MLAPGRISANAAAVEEFPAGLRVLVVDDDVMCLRILERMLHRCRYHVTTCCRATVALSLLREMKGSYDVVISDVHMPDMDGFKLLEHVGLEMDLPVIMMSADEGTSAVMRGIKHGACDYLIKPVRMEELKNIWQHVIRKKWNGNKELEHSGSLEDSDRNHRVTDDADYASSVNDGAEGTWRSQKKKRDAKEDEDEEEGELESDDPSASKKPRVVWSVELHQQFVCAVNQLGIEKAVPKRILELMNVPGLTRENVASHLQKFRLYLKRLSGVAQHHGGLHNPFCVPLESNSKLGELGSLDFQALVSSGQIPPQTLAALHAELLGRPSGGLVLPALHKPGILQASSALGPKCIPIESGVAFGQPLLKCQSNISEQFPEVTNYPRLTGTTRGVNTTQNGRLVPYTVSEGSHHAINIRPSSLVVPSLSPDNFQSTVAIPSQDSSSIQSGVAQGSDGVLKNVGMLNEYSARRPVSSSESSCSARTDTNSAWEVYNSSLNLGPATELTDLGSEAKTGTLPNQGHVRYLGFVGKGTCIPSRFAVEDFEPPTNHVSHRKAYVGGDGERVKQGIHLDFTDSSKFGNAVLPPFLANDPMRILSNDGFAEYFLKS